LLSAIPLQERGFGGAVRLNSKVQTAILCFSLLLEKESRKGTNITHFYRERLSYPLQQQTKPITQKIYFCCKVLPSGEDLGGAKQKQPVYFITSAVLTQKINNQCNALKHCKCSYLATR